MASANQLKLCLVVVVAAAGLVGADCGGRNCDPGNESGATIGSLIVATSGEWAFAVSSWTVDTQCGSPTFDGAALTAVPLAAPENAITIDLPYFGPLGRAGGEILILERGPPASRYLLLSAQLPLVAVTVPLPFGAQKVASVGRHAVFYSGSAGVSERAVVVHTEGTEDATIPLSSYPMSVQGSGNLAFVVTSSGLVSVIDLEVRGVAQTLSGCMPRSPDAFSRSETLAALIGPDTLAYVCDGGGTALLDTSAGTLSIVDTTFEGVQIFGSTAASAGLRTRLVGNGPDLRQETYVFSPITGEIGSSTNLPRDVVFIDEGRALVTDPNAYPTFVSLSSGMSMAVPGSLERGGTELERIGNTALIVYGTSITFIDLTTGVAVRDPITIPPPPSYPQ